MRSLLWSSKFCVPNLVFVLLGSSSATAQFPNFPEADRVLGSVDFATVGSKQVTPSTFDMPWGLASDPIAGKIFVASRSQNRVLRFDINVTSGNGASAETVFGQENFYTATSASTSQNLDQPWGLHLDSHGRLWIADRGNNRILMFDQASDMEGFGAAAGLVLGQPDFITNSEGTSPEKMASPTGVYLDGKDNLWVADSGNNRVLKFSGIANAYNGMSATAVLGQPDFSTNSSSTGQFKMRGPTAVTCDAAGRLWVADKDNLRVLRFDNAATLPNGSGAHGVLGQRDFSGFTVGSGPTNIIEPTALVLDSHGTLFVSDPSNQRVVFFKEASLKPNGSNADGVIGNSSFWGIVAGTSKRLLNGPAHGLAIDGTGKIWVSDQNNRRVLRFSPDKTAIPPVVGTRIPRTTHRSSFRIHGNASDSSEVGEVRYHTGETAYRKAIGTTSWRFSIRLRPGVNSIAIVTVDSLGNVSSPTKVRIRRLKATKDRRPIHVPGRPPGIDHNISMFRSPPQ